MLHTGKKPFVPDDRDVKLRAVAPAAALAAPPARFGWGLSYPDWGMLANGPDPTALPGAQEGCGDCVWAGAAHETRLWNHSVGVEVAFNGTCVVADYSAATDYDPSQTQPDGSNPTDNGSDVRNALLYRQKTGISDAAGNRHRIGAFVALTAGDVAELMAAAYWFEVVGVGIQFPNTAMDQFNQGKPWDVVPGAQIEGGHYIVATGRRSPDDLGFLTWGRRQSVTQKFYETYADEAWAAVSVDELRNGVSRRGLDLSGLVAALQSLGIAVPPAA